MGFVSQSESIVLTHRTFGETDRPSQTRALKEIRWLLAFLGAHPARLGRGTLVWLCVASQRGWRGRDVELHLEASFWGTMPRLGESVFLSLDSGSGAALKASPSAASALFGVT